MSDGMYLGDRKRAWDRLKQLAKVALGLLILGILIGGALLGPCFFGCAVGPQIGSERIANLEQVTGTLAARVHGLEVRLNTPIGAANTAVGGDQTITNEVWPWAITTVVIVGVGAWRTWVWRRKRKNKCHGG